MATVNTPAAVVEGHIQVLHRVETAVLAMLEFGMFRGLYHD